MLLACVVGAAVLVALGVWGWRAVPGMVPEALGVEERKQKEQMLRRGVVACFLAAAILLYFVIDSALY
jgi:threonine/homoserine/homoserine lactone efflux protein